MFVKNIYQVWFQGCENVKDEKFKQNIKNWEILNPDWNYFCLNEFDLQNACALYSNECLNAYNKIDSMHVKIDLGKMVFLYLYGGIIVDMDMYILRSLDFSVYVNDIINYYNETGKDIIGLSLNNVNLFESLIINGTKKTYGNAVLIASPKNEIIKGWVDLIINNILELPSKPNQNKFDIVNKTSGPKVFNKYIQSIKQNNSKIIDIPFNIFEPCLINGNCYITNDTISIHKFELSWVPDIYKNLLTIYYDYKLIIYILIFIAFIIFIKRVNFK
jgi:mannosyltransferase OCH1-like enzyme